MSNILQELEQFGGKRNIQALRSYVSNLEVDKITSFLNENIHQSNIEQLIHYILQGLTDSTENERKASKIVLGILKIIDDKEIHNRQSSAIIMRICLHLKEFKSEYLIQIIDYCIEKIQSGNVTATSWQDILPDVLNTIVEWGYSVRYNNTDMSGSEYRNQIINTLCMICWSPNIATMLALMFTEISLTTEEHTKVITKFGQCMDKMTCQEVPAFTHQLLRLCRNQNSKCVFLRLQYYFSTRIYRKLFLVNPESSDMSDLDNITDTLEEEARNTESTVLYHIYKYAVCGFESLKDYLTSMKLMKTSPEFVLHPFQLSVLLTISSIRYYEDRVMELIRMCVTRSIQEEFKREESIWFQEIVPSTMKVEKIILYIIENGISERELVMKGLVELGFVFLGVKVALGTKHIAEKHWELGNLILVKIVKKQREVAEVILRKLCRNIHSGQNVKQYTDCLAHMCRSLMLIMLENQTIITQLIGELSLASGNTSNLVINAILPLVKVSVTIRDNLILLLRKSLWGASLEIRQMAVQGFLKLLSSVRVTNLAVWSQSGTPSGSLHSVITQLTIECRPEHYNNKVNNEALCLEILSILRRCFILDVEVKTQFYENLCEGVCMNSELGIPVLDLLRNHFNTFYIFEEETLPPLDFTRITVTRGAEIVLQEPIGQLIYRTGCIIIKVKESVDADNGTVKSFELALESLIQRMTKCELIHFELDDGTDLTDIIPESQTKLHVLKQAMSVYEALMGYLIYSWNSNSCNNGKKINNLFQAYVRLSDLLKNINKPKKMQGKKDKDETEKNKTSKPKNMIKITDYHVLDLPVISKILSLLHEPTVSWSTVAETNVLKIKREFHRYVLNVGLHLIQSMKTSKSADLKSTNIYFDHCVEIAAILYERVVQRLDCVIDFDCQTCALALELFHNILIFINTNYKNKFGLFLSKVALKESDTDLDENLSSFVDVYKKLVEMEENETLSEDPDGKKIPVTIVNTFCFLVMHLPKHKPETLLILDWLKHYLSDNTVANRQVGNSLIQLWFSLHTKCKTTGTLFENVAVRLCDVIGTVNSEIKPECPVELKSINEGTVLNTLTVLTNIMKTHLDEIDWLINRFKSEYSVIIYPGADNIERKRENLKMKERDLCCHVCQIIIVCQLLSNLGVPNGTYTDAILKILIHLYNTLSNLTKYFMIRSSKTNLAFENARFERVVKLSGKKFNNIISDFILTLEQNQEPEEKTQTKKQKVDGTALKSKVLKDTRQIPKLVYEIEQYGKNIIQLSNKTKVDLSKFIGPGTSRDFRIKAPDLKAVLEKINETNYAEETMNTTAENEPSTSNDEGRTEVNEESMEVEENADESMETEENSDKENEQNENIPPKKRSRMSR